MNSNQLELIISAQDQATKVLRGVEGALQSAQQQAQNLANKGFKMVQSSASQAFDVIKKGTVVLAGFGTVLGGMAIKSASDMETMSIALETSCQGNVKQAQDAQKAITEFATRTPYQLQEVMTGFIKLKNMGLDPSQRALTAYGNTASAMGKGLNDMVEAVADAATGEFERLKEFGIRASKQGDQVKFTFKGVEQTVKMNSKDIEGYLIKLGETNFAGGMDKQSQSLKGLMSTLKDSVSLTLGQLAKDTGLIDGVKVAVTGITNALNKFDPQPVKNATAFLYEFFELLATGSVTSGDGFFNYFGENSKNVIQNINNVRGAFLDLWDLITTGSIVSGDGLNALFGSGASDKVQAFYDQMIILFGTISDRGSKMFDFVTTQILPMIQPVLSQLGSLFMDQLLPTIIGVSQRITDVMAFAMPYISQLVKIAMDIISPIITRIATEIFPLILPAIDAFIGAFRAIMPFIMPILQFLVERVGTTINAVISIFKGVIQAVTGVFQILQGIFTGDGEKIKQGFLNIFRGIETAVGGIFKGVMNNIISTINLGIRQVNTLVDKIPDDVFRAFGKSKGDVRLPELPRFANGGIVGGSSYTGDKILARVNSGEVILNQKQQQNALQQMEGGNTINNNFYISGGNSDEIVKKVIDTLSRQNSNRRLGMNNAYA